MSSFPLLGGTTIGAGVTTGAGVVLVGATTGEGVRGDTGCSKMAPIKMGSETTSVPGEVLVVMEHVISVSSSSAIIR